MKILIATPSYWPRIGGIERIGPLLAKEIRSSGIDVEILTHLHTKDIKKYTHDEYGTEIKYIDFKHPADRSVPKFRRIKIYLSLFVFAFRSKPDILYIRWVDWTSWYFLIIKKILQIPAVVSIHGSDVNKLPFVSDFGKQFLIDTLKSADRIISTSNILIKKAEEISNLDLSKKYYIIPNGIDLKRFDNKVKYISGKPYILAIGRLVYAKGFDLLLEAFKKLCENVPEIELIIAGGGEEKNNLIDKAKILGISDRVKLIGPVDESTVVSLLNGCRLFVCSSRSEGFGNVILEAMAAGKPIVSFGVGGVVEIIQDDINGILCEPGNICDLVKNILNLLKSEEECNRLAMNGYLYVKENYSCEVMAKRYIKVFNSLIETKKSLKDGEKAV
ncbi:MAG: glycosyltransferase family 4 protein [bacterium]|nr:glycosyltransferase family 4 protein [bacterium]